MVETRDSRVTYEDAALQVAADDVSAMKMHLGALEDRVKALEDNLERTQQLIGGAPAAPESEGLAGQADHPMEQRGEPRG